MEEEDEIPPLDYISEEFDRDYIQTRRRYAGIPALLVFEKFPFDTINGTISRYSLKIVISVFTFKIKFQPSHPDCNGVYTTTTVTLRKLPKSENDMRVRRTYRSLLYNYECDETASRYLMFYAYHSSWPVRFQELVLTLPPRLTEFTDGRLFTAERIVLLIPSYNPVNDGTTHLNLIGTWLRTVQCEALPQLVIDSPIFPIGISSNEIAHTKLRTVRWLIINGTAIIDARFLHDFRGTDFVYNNDDGELPIPIEEIIGFWLTHVHNMQETQTFLFNTIQPYEHWSAIRESLRSPGDYVVNYHGVKKVVASNHNRIFEMSNTHLMMEWKSDKPRKSRKKTKKKVDQPGENHQMHMPLIILV